MKVSWDSHSGRKNLGRFNMPFQKWFVFWYSFPIATPWLETHLIAFALMMPSVVPSTSSVIPEDEIVQMVCWSKNTSSSCNKLAPLWHAMKAWILIWKAKNRFVNRIERCTIFYPIIMTTTMALHVAFQVPTCFADCRLSGVKQFMISNKTHHNDYRILCTVPCSY